MFSKVPCVSGSSRNKLVFPESQAQATGQSPTLTLTSRARPYICSQTDMETLRTSVRKSPWAGLVQDRAALFRISTHCWKPSSGKERVTWCLHCPRCCEEATCNELAVLLRRVLGSQRRQWRINCEYGLKCSDEKSHWREFHGGLRISLDCKD